jgi:hypothetical protein
MLILESNTNGVILHLISHIMDQNKKGKQSLAHAQIRLEIIFNPTYYLASITFSEMADCDWLRSTFSRPLFSRNGQAVHYIKTNACILKQNNKTN